jgi:hypothetical protein
MRARIVRAPTRVAALLRPCGDPRLGGAVTSHRRGYSSAGRPTALEDTDPIWYSFSLTRAREAKRIPPVIPTSVSPSRVRYRGRRELIGSATTAIRSSPIPPSWLLGTAPKRPSSTGASGWSAPGSRQVDTAGGGIKRRRPKILLSARPDHDRRRVSNGRAAQSLRWA